MGLISGRNLKQDLTYWAPSSRNAYNELTFAAPVKIKGRWTEKATQVRSPKGDVLVTRALIHTNVPVVEAGWLALGDQTGHADPTSTGLDVHTCAEIVVTQQYPDLRNLELSNAAYI